MNKFLTYKDNLHCFNFIVIEIKWYRKTNLILSDLHMDLGKNIVYRIQVYIS